MQEFYHEIKLVSRFYFVSIQFYVKPHTEVPACRQAGVEYSPDFPPEADLPLA